MNVSTIRFAHLTGLRHNGYFTYNGIQSKTMNHYDTIACAIQYIRDNIPNQVTLDQIAARAGVSPKRFMQAVTLERAKLLIRKNHGSLLDISDELGLSSGSRLYDHFVQLEAVTPSEFKSEGDGLTIYWGQHMTDFGWAFLAHTDRGVCRLAFAEESDPSALATALACEWPKAGLFEDQQSTGQIIKHIFSNAEKVMAPLSLWVRGTNFQISVWRALLNIGAGELKTYSDIAKAVGRPGAVRAVGTAIGANPIAYAIPCHRVIRQTGALGGYRWGAARKHAMLARELASRHPCDEPDQPTQ